MRSDRQARGALFIRHRAWAFGVALLLLLAVSWAGSAHRLDEYLQATLLDLGLDHVGIEMDLTPGVDVAARVLEWIDVNRDGAVSTAETEAYSDLVLRGVRFEVDGRRRDVKARDTRMPQVEELKSGVGTIRIQAEVNFDPIRAGEHRFFFHTRHLTNLSVYLVNALTPESPRIKIVRQTRDAGQTEIQIDCVVEKRPK
ncbi:MAG: hypothetical protein HY299_04825 [Verrucomicrobia bacterium]|nr:hypothetical protein [Verrucomicrobiota bacterium]